MTREMQIIITFTASDAPNSEDVSDQGDVQAEILQEDKRKETVRGYLLEHGKNDKKTKCPNCKERSPIRIVPKQNSELAYNLV